MMGNKILRWVIAAAVTVCLAFTTVHRARAQNTISSGIMSSITSSGAYTGGTLDSVYVTAVFNTNAYIQDGTGGIYFFKGTNTQGIAGLTVGTQIIGLGVPAAGGTTPSGGFYYYTTGTQWEYEPATSTTNYNYTSLNPGTYRSIPASYYTSMTLTAFNSPSVQGDVTAKGMQNQLVTLNNVLITGSGGIFAAGSYTLTDTAGTTGTMYINAASGLVGTTIPSGSVNVSGVFQDFHGTSELLPRDTYDITTTTVPEPSSILLASIGALGLVLTTRRMRRSA